MRVPFNAVPTLPSEMCREVPPRRPAGCRDDLIVGDYVRWADQPGASLLIHGHSEDYFAVAISRIYAGQVVELRTYESGFVGALPA